LARAIRAKQRRWVSCPMTCMPCYSGPPHDCQRMVLPLPPVAVPAKSQDGDDGELSLSDFQRDLRGALQSHQQHLQESLQAWTGHQTSQFTQLLARHDRLERLLQGLVGKSPSSADATGCSAEDRALGDDLAHGACEHSMSTRHLPHSPLTRHATSLLSSEVVHTLIHAGSAATVVNASESHKGMKERSSTENLVHLDARTHWRRMIRKAESKRHHSNMRIPKTFDDPQRLTPLRRLVRSRHYELTVIFVVAVNTLFIGWQTQYAALYHQPPAFESVSENVFCAIFFLELVLRSRAEGLNFCISTDWSWNLFDSVVVLTMVSERILRLAYDGSVEQLSKVSMLRIMRVVRVVRIMHVIRVMKFFRELRMMVMSIMRSIKSLVWVVLVLSLLFYVFGISLVQGVVVFCNTEDKWESTDTAALRDNFGTLDRSFLALFEAMSGGVSWGELLDVLKPLPLMYTLIFLTFIAFAIFGVVNIVTGVFVENAMQSGIQDRDTIVQEELLEKETYVEKIKLCFQELDIEHHGCIGLAEFQQAVEDKKVVALINAIGLDITDVQSLFILLDRDQSGSIDIEEFLVGCLRLKGVARTLDIAKLQLEVEFLVHVVDFIATNMHAQRHVQHSALPRPVTHQDLPNLDHIG